jgi:hypothetical protein
MGAGVKPSFLQTNASTRGERCALVPTAPESFPTATTSRTVSKRRSARPNSSCISAIFKPNVVGSPWMPWLRPMHGVNLCSFARRAMTGKSFFTSAIKDVRALHHLHGVAGVAHVAARQAEMKPAAGVVVDGFGDGGGETDDVVVENFFQFALAGDEAGQIGEPFVAAGFDLREIFGGNDFSFTSASLASSSICSQILSLFSSVQMARISGRE